MPNFVNPYAFVWTPDRTSARTGAGDEQPESNGTSSVDDVSEPTWSGELRLQLTVATPLLILDDTTKEYEDLRINGRTHRHWTYRTRRVLGDPDTPDLPATAVKGPLRAAYEAVTNSRFGVFDTDINNQWGRQGQGVRGTDFGTWKKKPTEYLHTSLRPATSLEDLSPANRLFGVVSEPQGKNPGFQVRGRLRIVSVSHSIPDRHEAIKHEAIKHEASKHEAIKHEASKHEAIKEEKLVLKELGLPAGKYAPFYLRKKDGSHIGAMAQREFYDGNLDEFRLSGRKFYWHHPDFTVDTATTTQRTKRNRSVADYITVGTKFTVVIRLDSVEERDLLELLRLLHLLEAEAFLKLGHGKPLGFGSVNLKVTGNRLESDSEVARRVKELDSAPEWSDALPESLRDQLPQTNPPSYFTQFAAIAKGRPNLEIKYPPGGYRWFVTNNGRGAQGLTDFQTLPHPDAKEPSLEE